MRAQTSFFRLWSECLCPPPPNSYVELLTLNVMMFGRGVFGTRLGHEGGAHMSGISAFIKETPERFPSPSATWGHSEKSAICHPEEGPHPDLAQPSEL